jgi:hypothetical protein
VPRRRIVRSDDGRDQASHVDRATCPGRRTGAPGYPSRGGCAVILSQSAPALWDMM